MPLSRYTAPWPSFIIPFQAEACLAQAHDQRLLIRFVYQIFAGSSEDQGDKIKGSFFWKLLHAATSWWSVPCELGHHPDYLLHIQTGEIHRELGIFQINVI